MIYLAFALWMGIGAGVVGRIKGSSFFIWFVIGVVLPVLGLLAAVFYRSDRDEDDIGFESLGDRDRLDARTELGGEFAEGFGAARKDKYRAKIGPGSRNSAPPSFYARVAAGLRHSKDHN